MDVKQSDYRDVFLRPGELHVAHEPTIIRTTLGSCVSVCLYSVMEQVGAMSHSVLPVPPKGAKNDVRYVEYAIGTMLDDMVSMGVPIGSIKAKLFGGAEMFHLNADELRFARIVGDGNTKAARECLARMGLEIVSECVGGSTGRKLVFETTTGVAMVWKLMHSLPAEQFMMKKGRAV